MGIAGALLVTLSVGVFFASMSFDNEVFNAEQWGRALTKSGGVDLFLMEKADGDFHKDTFSFGNPCKANKWDDSKPTLDCILDATGRRVAFANAMKQQKDGKVTYERWWKGEANNESMKNIFDFDYDYVVWEARQIAFNAGYPVDMIKNPAPVQFQILSSLTNDHSLSLFAAFFIGLFLLAPVAWVNLWRVVGIAIRTAKTEMKGE